MDQLLLEKNRKFHCLITKIQDLMTRQTDTRFFKWRNCLCGSYGLEHFKIHKIICADKPCCIKMKPNTRIPWGKFSATMQVSFTVYADVEAFTPNIVESWKNPCTRKIKKQNLMLFFSILLEWVRKSLQKVFQLKWKLYYRIPQHNDSLG